MRTSPTIIGSAQSYAWPQLMPSTPSSTRLKPHIRYLSHRRRFLTTMPGVGETTGRVLIQGSLHRRIGRDEDNLLQLKA
jgi:hypothetical protein